MATRFICLRLVAFLSFCLPMTVAVADPAPFDLEGPRIEVTVTRGDQTLPITEVPNLAVGDKLWIHADFPPAQSAHYLLIAAFLRGSTNPPSENWFFKSETWNRKAEAAGLRITVPEGAQQIILFLAPETGGDFKTLVNAVRGRPGAFVRASQDLNQASLDHSRLEVYLDAIRRIGASDPAQLKEVSPLLARSLSIQLNSDCLKQDVGEQASCLAEKQDTLILNDGHSMSIVGAITSGPGGDLALQASYTPQASFGYYSPYVASIIDIARIMDSFHTAEYQYIPALASQDGDALNLKLNTPPSFHNPKSVLVIALPAIESPQPPPLHPVNDKQVFCATKNALVLPVDGAPLVFSTRYARNLQLYVEGAGKKIDLPLKPDPAKGGLIVDNKSLTDSGLGSSVQASVKGSWGFAPYTGPTFRLQAPREQTWEIAPADKTALVVGRDDTIHLQANDASCVESVGVKDSQGTEQKADWKVVKNDQLEVKLPLKNAKPGLFALVIKQAGVEKTQEIPLHTFAEAGRLEGFTLHAGDQQGILKGSRLDEVAGVAIDGIPFTPGHLSTSEGTDELALETKDQKAANFTAGAQLKAVATLRDGRTVDLPVTVEPPRPKATLLSKNIEPDEASTASNIQISGQDELPQSSKLTFSLKAQSPATFSRQDKIEVATVDGAYSTFLDMGNGTLVLQDAKTALATFDPSKAFGSSAFGPIQFRMIDADGVKGDWQPLVSLVRLPGLHDLECPAAADQPCSLAGSGLFLIDSVSSDALFSHPVQVPDGFPGNVLSVPHPEGNELYVKLRDDPAQVNLVTLSAEPMTTPKPQSVSTAPQAGPSITPGTGSPPSPAPASAAQQAPAPSRPAKPSPAPQTGAASAASTNSPQASSTTSQP